MYVSKSEPLIFKPTSKMMDVLNSSEYFISINIKLPRLAFVFISCSDTIKQLHFL